jgi:hypothetical protein
MTAYTFDDSTVSDLHKDAYGWRPSEAFWAKWNNSTPEQKQVIWDGLVETLEESIDLERKMQASALEAFEARVTESIQAGARDRNQAIKWILQAEGLDGERDPGYVCYQLGLSYEHEGMFALFCGD